MSTQYKVTNGITQSKVIFNNDNSITWCGTLANDIRHEINRKLREEGISIQLHGVEFVNKTIKDILKKVSNVVGTYENK